MPRAMWKADVQVGERAVPVKLYAALEDHRIHFHLLHASDHQRVVQRFVRPDTGEVIPNDEITKGYAVDKHAFVPLDADELEAIEPKPSRDIVISRCVPRGAIAPHWFDHPYYLGPDGSATTYAALARALEEAECDALAHWVMRGHSYDGVIRAQQGTLHLITLHAREEVLNVDGIEPNGRPADARELQLAQQLVSALRAEPDLEQFTESYHDRVLELIEAKAKGKRVPKRRVTHKRATSSSVLQAQLRASLAHAKRGHAKERKSA